jgi:hypothetical protein
MDSPQSGCHKPHMTLNNELFPLPKEKIKIWHTQLSIIIQGCPEKVPYTSVLVATAVIWLATLLAIYSSIENE